MREYNVARVCLCRSLIFFCLIYEILPASEVFNALKTQKKYNL